MADGVGEFVYSIGTNSLMDWQARYYPTDVFAGLVARIDALMASGRWVATPMPSSKRPTAM